MWSRVVTASLATAALFVLCTGCRQKVPEPEPEVRKDPPGIKEDQPKVTELVKEDVKVGEGPEAKTGDTVKVHYTGRLMSGTKFDSSLDKGDPFEFTLGKGQVIKGWDQGVVGMKVGGKRKLTIPSKLAYGKRGSPPKIKPDSPLQFDIELLEVVGAETDEDDAPDAKKSNEAKPAAKPAVKKPQPVKPAPAGSAQ